MSRFLSLINKNSKTTNALFRMIMSKQPVAATCAQSKLLSSSSNQVEKSIEATSELDKPQWERSNRFKIFYGFNEKDEADDKGMAHFITFIGIFGFIFCPIFALYFYPDYRMNHWCYREAHLELARRENAGEPLVNPDLIPVDKIKLPSDEELGDMEIII